MPSWWHPGVSVPVQQRKTYLHLVHLKAKFIKTILPCSTSPFKIGSTYVKLKSFRYAHIK